MQELKKKNKIKIHGSGTTTLIISNKEKNYIMKIVQPLEDSNILLKGVTKINKNETKEQKGGFSGTMVGFLGSILLGNLLSGKRIVRASSGNKKRKRNCKSWLWERMAFLTLSHSLTNFEIQKYYQNEPRFNGVYSRDNLPKQIKDGAYVINLDEHKDTGTHWIALFCNRNEIVYFDSFGVEHIPEEIKEFIGNKNIKANIFRVQANDSIMCGYFCIGFIDFILAGKKQVDFTNIFAPYEKNDSIILSYFKDEWNKFDWPDKIQIKRNNHALKSKYVTTFDYIDKILTVLSATDDGVSIIYFTSVEGAPVGRASARFTLIFSLTTGIIKKLA